jgi:A/G-specific adenine glycosylase
MQGEFATALLSWFDVHGRHELPWQRDITPYRVWVSEIMLQQTQVATVIPYFERFMARFPDVRALAAAPLDEVLHLWTGLGYYARGRNLHAAAKQLVQSGGLFPTDIEAVTELPGIGRSTAGAILSIACRKRHPILDGNVKRVLSRVYGIEGDPNAKGTLEALWAKAEELTPTTRIADYTQAIMDLGATLCTRSRPACTLCPMALSCVAAREGRQQDLPGRKVRRSRPQREATLLIARAAGAKQEVFLERRPASGVWGGLWSPPQFADEAQALAWVTRTFGDAGALHHLPPIDHAFTHFDLRLKPVEVECRVTASVREGEQIWYSLDRPPRLGLPQPIKALLERLHDSPPAQVE